MRNCHQTIGKSTECLGHWAFEFGYCLEFEYWDLGFYVNDAGSGLIQSYWLIINSNVSLSAKDAS